MREPGPVGLYDFGWFPHQYNRVIVWRYLIADWRHFCQGLPAYQRLGLLANTIEGQFIDVSI